jgi:hypothetical protein
LRRPADVPGLPVLLGVSEVPVILVMLVVRVLSIDDFWMGCQGEFGDSV